MPDNVNGTIECASSPGNARMMSVDSRVRVGTLRESLHVHKDASAMPQLGRTSFRDMADISADTLEVLAAQGYSQATPVQEAVIPLFCANKDVAVDAATGSGKTLAFIIPIVERLRKAERPSSPREVLALVVSPTRELAMQIQAVAEPFFAALKCHRLCGLIGGTDVVTDTSAVRDVGANCIVGTPGRVDDVMKRVESLSFRRFEMLVLDEADRLLELGFQRHLDAIIARLPKQRRTGLFSATQTEAVESLVRAGLRNPFRVNVALSSDNGSHGSARKTPLTLSVRYALLELDEKLAYLRAFLRAHAGDKVIVYFLTCASVEYFAALLPQLPEGTAVVLMALHGNMKQRKRSEVLQRFRQTPGSVLLCTDLAARGLDIPDVHWVLQFDPPQRPDTFLHRCGRTARMGRSGKALALLLPHEEPYVELLRNRGVPLSQQERPDDVASTSDAQRRLSERDRGLMEKGARAFVSYVRGYKEHHCRFIFQLSELDIARLGRLFGLLRLPVMKEVRKCRTGLEAFQQSEVDPDEVPYTDAKREAARRKALRAARESGTDRASVGEQRKRAREKEAAARAVKDREKKVPAAKRQLQQRRQDADDLDSDYSLVRKLKRGKLSDAEFDRQIGLVE